MQKPERSGAARARAVDCLTEPGIARLTRCLTRCHGLAPCHATLEPYEAREGVSTAIARGAPERDRAVAIPVSWKGMDSGLRGNDIEAYQKRGIPKNNPGS